MYADNLTPAEVAALLHSNPWNRPEPMARFMRAAEEANFPLVESTPFDGGGTYHLYVSRKNEGHRAEIVWSADGNAARIVRIKADGMSTWTPVLGPTALIAARLFMESI